MGLAILESFNFPRLTKHFMLFTEQYMKIISQQKQLGKKEAQDAVQLYLEAPVLNKMLLQGEFFLRRDAGAT